MSWSLGSRPIELDEPVGRRTSLTLWFLAGLVAVVVVASFWAGAQTGESIGADADGAAAGADGGPAGDALTVADTVAAGPAGPAESTTTTSPARFRVEIVATRLEAGAAGDPIAAAEGPYVCSRLTATNEGGVTGTFWLSDLFLVDPDGTAHGVSMAAAGKFALTGTAPGDAVKGEACFPTFHRTGRFLLEQRAAEDGAVLASWPVDL